MHTPGPWIVSDEGPAIITIEATDGREACVLAEIDNAALPDTEDKANARLMAAAPEMLEALKECRYYLAEVAGPNDDIYNRALLKADDVIRKAEGQKVPA